MIQSWEEQGTNVEIWEFPNFGVGGRPSHRRKRPTSVVPDWVIASAAEI
jgi:hypothetical protein